MTGPDRVLERLPAAKRELARLLAERAAVPEQPGPRPAGSTAAATAMQERLWRYGRDVDPAAGTGAHALRLRGRLDPEALRAALTAVLRRHEALRTSLADGPDGVVQQVAAEPRLRFDADDLSGLGAAGRADAVAEAQARAAALTLDPGAGDTTRFRLLRLAPDEHVLVLAAHLAVFDGWSSAVLLQDLGDAYRGVPAGPAPPQLPDVAAWQRRWLAGPTGRAALDGLCDRLAGYPPAPAPGPGGFARGHLPVGLDPEVTAAGFALGAGEGATPFMTLLAALSVVLARRSGADRVVIGTPAAGRLFPGAESAIGQFTTVVPVAVDCSGRPAFGALLRRTRTAVSEALADQRLPVDTVLAALARRGRRPPYSLLFALHNYPAVPLDLPGVTTTAVPGPPARHLELYSPDPSAALACIGLVERDGSVGGTAEYNRLAVGADHIRTLLRDLQQVLGRAVDDPSAALLP